MGLHSLNFNSYVTNDPDGAEREIRWKASPLRDSQTGMISVALVHQAQPLEGDQRRIYCKPNPYSRVTDPPMSQILLSPILSPILAAKTYYYYRLIPMWKLTEYPMGTFRVQESGGGG
jgi:hypothetical protein